MLKKVCAGLAVGTVTFVLSGCNGDVSSVDLSPSPSPTQPTVSANLDFDDDSSNGDSDDADGTGGDVTFASDEECLTDTWRLDNDSWVDAVSGSFASGGVTLVALDGTVLMDLRDDGTFSSVYQNWTISTSMAEMGGSGTIERDGVDSGTWSVSGDTVEITESSSNSVVNTMFEIDGQTMSMDGIEGQADAIETFRFDCDASTLVATTAEGTFTFSRN